MRRVSVKLGLKERMNDILGTDISSYENGVPDITPWSIQAAMMENSRRIIRGIVGETDKGRVLRGMIINGSGNTITIPKGIAFTPSGNVIVLGADLTRTVSGAGSTRYIYVNHLMLELPGLPSGVAAGKKTTFINSAGTAEIVYDAAASVYDTAAQSHVNELSADYSALTPSPDSVFLGTVTLDGDGLIDVVTPTTNRGFGPCGNEAMMYLSGIHSKVESIFDTKTTVNDSFIINAITEVNSGGKIKFKKESNLTVVDGNDDEKTGLSNVIDYTKPNDTPGTLTFVKGILVAYT